MISLRQWLTTPWKGIHNCINCFVDTYWGSAMKFIRAQWKITQRSYLLAKKIERMTTVWWLKHTCIRIRTGSAEVAFCNKNKQQWVERQFSNVNEMRDNHFLLRVHWWTHPLSKLRLFQTTKCPNRPQATIAVCFCTKNNKATDFAVMKRK